MAHRGNNGTRQPYEPNGSRHTGRPPRAQWKRLLGSRAVKPVGMGINPVIHYKSGSIPLLVPLYTGILLVIVNGTQPAGTHNTPGPGTLSTRFHAHSKLARPPNATYDDTRPTTYYRPH